VSLYRARRRPLGCLSIDAIATLSSVLRALASAWSRSGGGGLEPER
jgi:hypothetical protein